VNGLEFTGVVKDYRGLRPLRVSNLAVAAGERVALAGLDVPAAEVFVSLATGSGLPDQGDVRVMGEPTSAITDGDAWLSSLDRFGIVSHRAVLVDAVTVAQNIAMSYSLSIEPVPDDIRAKVDALARAVGLSAADLEKSSAMVSAAARVRAHLARALAHDPLVLLLEHPTVGVERGDARALGESLAAATRERAIAVLALTDDDEFAKGMDGRRLKLNASTGAVTKSGGWFAR
jgi:ABC-type lipoprotein export system ATPase subunit